MENGTFRGKISLPLYPWQKCNNYDHWDSGSGSDRLSVSLSVCLSLCLSFIFYLFVSVSVSLSLCLSVSVFTYSFFTRLGYPVNLLPDAQLWCIGLLVKRTRMKRWSIIFLPRSGCSATNTQVLLRLLRMFHMYRLLRLDAVDRFIKGPKIYIYILYVHICTYTYMVLDISYPSLEVK